jgi:hypothetical protein
MELPEEALVSVFAIYVAIGLLVERFGSLPAKKRFLRVSPYVVVPAFLGFLYATGSPLLVCAAIAPFLILIAYLNTIFVTYCDRCGKRNAHPWQRAKYCLHCGASLNNAGGN